MSQVTNIPDPSIIAEFGKCRLAVIGDSMLDRFLWGKVHRISPEAPVPVVKLDRETRKLGGAANVAANIRALGAEVVLFGLTGEDEAGVWMEELLTQRGIDSQGMVVADDRPTTIKTRIIAHNQQVVRTDWEDDSKVSDKYVEQLLQRLEAMGPFDGYILSDYGKGVLTDEALQRCIALAQVSGSPIIVDPKKGDYSQYKGVTSLTPNQKEAEQACALAITDENSLTRAGSVLLERTAAEAVLITRGEHGMALFDKDGRQHHLPTEASHVFDVTGAGDTVISVYTTALAAGADFALAASLANHAAGVAVREVGTVAVSADQLRLALSEKEA